MIEKPQIRPLKLKKGENQEEISINDTVRDVRHVKASRELLRWDQEKLAREAGLSLVSVRRYEAARDEVADSIGVAILAALEKAGVVFVDAGKTAGTEVSGGVLLRSSACPEPPASKRIYVYADKSPGRPAGTKDTASRKERVDKRSDRP